MLNFILPKFNFNVEKWKFNKEYGVYVSNLGNFKDRYKRNLPIKIDGKDGYCAVLTEVGYVKSHRLVLYTWKPIPNAENLTVDHLNHNKRDNNLKNLEWVTKEENEKRAKEDIVHTGISTVILINDIILKPGTDPVDFINNTLKIKKTNGHIFNITKEQYSNKVESLKRKVLKGEESAFSVIVPVNKHSDGLVIRVTKL